MAQLHHVRKQRLLVLLILHLEMLNQFTLLLMSICTVLLADRLGRRVRKRIRYDHHSRAVIRDANFHRIVEEFDSSETQQAANGVGKVGQGSGSTFARKGKKRARTENAQSQMLYESMDKLGGFFEDIRDNIAELSSCFKHEREHAKRKMSIYEEIKNVPGLTRREMIKAGIAIVEDPNLIDFFMQVEPDMKKEFIDEVLAYGTGN